MSFSYLKCDCSPLVIDQEFEIKNEEEVAEYIAKIVLGHYAHVKRIINALSASNPVITDSDLDIAIERLEKKGKTLKEIEKRDGWVFQIISWLALFFENKGQNFHCQQPHDAPAQHGLDGVAILLNKELKIENIIITEDKCTEHQRVVIPDIWKEFTDFEKGIHNNQLINRISALLENLDGGKILEENKNDIYKNEIRKYRVGINRNASYEKIEKRKKLFKGYDDCVHGETADRRCASTIYKDDIRNWMGEMCEKAIVFLKSQKEANV